MYRIITVCALLMVCSVPAITQKGDMLPERLTAVAMSTGGPRSDVVATRVDITINRWSTADEHQRLMHVLNEKGPEALLETLREMKPVGTINTPGDLAYDLHYAHQAPLGDGERRIFLATDRPITYWQAVNQPRIVNYPFTFIELRVNGRGEGEGKLALATRIDKSDDGKMIELVSYRAQPINLNEVRRR